MNTTNQISLEEQVALRSEAAPSNKQLPTTATSNYRTTYSHIARLNMTQMGTMDLARVEKLDGTTIGHVARLLDGAWVFVPVDAYLSLGTCEHRNLRPLVAIAAQACAALGTGMSIDFATAPEEEDEASFLPCVPNTSGYITWAAPAHRETWVGRVVNGRPVEDIPFGRSSQAGRYIETSRLDDGTYHILTARSGWNWRDPSHIARIEIKGGKATWMWRN